jgi:hypothetical protein
MRPRRRSTCRVRAARRVLLRVAQDEAVAGGPWSRRRARRRPGRHLQAAAHGDAIGHGGRSGCGVPGVGLPVLGAGGGSWRGGAAGAAASVLRVPPTTAPSRQAAPRHAASNMPRHRRPAPRGVNRRIARASCRRRAPLSRPGTVAAAPDMSTVNPSDPSTRTHRGRTERWSRSELRLAAQSRRAHAAHGPVCGFARLVRRTHPGNPGGQPRTLSAPIA